MKRSVWTLAWVVVVVSLGCDEVSESGPKTLGAVASAGDLTLPAGPVADRPWASRACKSGALDANTLACVDGVAITRDDYDRARLDLPDYVPARRVVEALVTAELLAGSAAAAGLWSDWLVAPYKRALARTWLTQVFEAGHPAEKVAVSDVQRAFRNASIRVRYKRQRSFFVTDAQLLCCSGSWQQCAARKEVTTCIEDKESAAAALHQALVSDPPTSAAEMQARTLVLSRQIPGVAVAEVQFYYDTTKTYDEQQGYDLMVQPYAEAVVKLEAGQISAPIRTPFGWHIARVDRIMPPLRGSPEDPVVRADIARNILPMVRRRDLKKTIFTRMAELGVKIHFDRLTR